VKEDKEDKEVDSVLYFGPVIDQRRL